jgi:hypothetical protein
MALGVFSIVRRSDDDDDGCGLAAGGLAPKPCR